MPGEDPHIDIGRLRWRVTLATRLQVPQEDAPGIDEPIVGGVKVYANIEAVGALTFWGTEQVDTPFSHRIFMRWHDYLDQAEVILRYTQRPDSRTMRFELFRVRRVKELGGRKRFVLIEAELEKAETA